MCTSFNIAGTFIHLCKKLFDLWQRDLAGETGSWNKVRQRLNDYDRMDMWICIEQKGTKIQRVSTPLTTKALFSFPFTVPAPSPSVTSVVLPSPPLHSICPARNLGSIVNSLSWVCVSRAKPQPTLCLVYSEREKLIWQQLLYGFLYTENSSLASI